MAAYRNNSILEAAAYRIAAVSSEWLHPGIAIRQARTEQQPDGGTIFRVHRIMGRRDEAVLITESHNAGSRAAPKYESVFFSYQSAEMKALMKQGPYFADWPTLCYFVNWYNCETGNRIGPFPERTAKTDLVRIKDWEKVLESSICGSKCNCVTIRSYCTT